MCVCVCVRWQHAHNAFKVLNQKGARGVHVCVGSVCAREREIERERERERKRERERDREVCESVGVDSE